MPSIPPPHPTLPLGPQVERQTPFLQGYRVLYRQHGGRWEEARVVQAPGERGALLTELRRGQDYEVKVRPYFHHLHGPDSAVRALRTPEAGECGDVRDGEGPWGPPGGDAPPRPPLQQPPVPHHELSAWPVTAPASASRGSRRRWLSRTASSVITG